MATKPVLRRAIAGQKSKASDYNWNFDQMINYLDNSVVELENETATINQAILTKATASLDNLTADGEARFDCKATTSLDNLTDGGKSYASQLPMPSSNYTNLTINASGSSYTAPANGWVYYDARSGGNAGSFASINVMDENSNNAYAVSTCIPTNGQHLMCFLPVKKNDVFKVYYGYVLEQISFRFIYAQGEEVPE